MNHPSGVASYLHDEYGQHAGSTQRAGDTSIRDAKRKEIGDTLPNLNGKGWGDLKGNHDTNGVVVRNVLDARVR